MATSANLTNDAPVAIANFDPAQLMQMVHNLQLENARLRQDHLPTQASEASGAATASRALDQASQASGAAVASATSHGSGHIPATTQSSSTASGPAADTAKSAPTAMKGQRISKDLADAFVSYAASTHRLGIMNFPWVPEFIIDAVPTAIDPYSSDRYKDAESRKAGIIAEFYLAFPVELQADLQLRRDIRKRIAEVVGRQRSTILFDVKCNLHLIFEEYTNVVQLIRNGQFDAPELVYLLKGNSDSYRRLPPILFPPGFEHKLALIYLGPCLLRIACVALWGRRFLENIGAVAGAVLPSSNTTGRKYGITETTPGLIAFSVEIARFLVSPDTQFTPIGLRSGINYFEDFLRVKEDITRKMMGRGPKAKQMQVLMHEWNAVVFPHVQNTTLQAAQTHSGTDDDLEFAWDEEDEDEDENGNGQALPNVPSPAGEHAGEHTGEQGIHGETIALDGAEEVVPGLEVGEYSSEEEDLEPPRPNAPRQRRRPGYIDVDDSVEYTGSDFEGSDFSDESMNFEDLAPLGATPKKLAEPASLTQSNVPPHAPGAASNEANLSGADVRSRPLPRQRFPPAPKQLTVQQDNNPSQPVMQPIIDGPQLRTQPGIDLRQPAIQPSIGDPQSIVHQGTHTLYASQDKQAYLWQPVDHQGMHTQYLPAERTHQPNVVPPTIAAVAQQQPSPPTTSCPQQQQGWPAVRNEFNVSQPGPMAPNYHHQMHLHRDEHSINQQLPYQYPAPAYSNQLPFAQHPPNQHGYVALGPRQSDVPSEPPAPTQLPVNGAARTLALARSYSGQDTRSPGLVDVPLRHSLSGPAPPSDVQLRPESILTDIPELPQQPQRTTTATNACRLTPDPVSNQQTQPAEVPRPADQEKKGCQPGRGGSGGARGGARSGARGGAGRGRRKATATIAPPMQAEANSDVANTAVPERRSTRKTSKRT